MHDRWGSRVHGKNMPPIRPQRGVRSAAIALLAFATACAYANRERNTDRHPDVLTGVSATVLMPGQSAPVLGLPGANAPRGTTGATGAPPAHPASPSRRPGGKPAPAPSSPSPGPATRGAPTPAGPVLIGGASGSEVSHKRVHEEPRWYNPFWFPFAVALAPFRLIGKALHGRSASHATQASRPPAPVPARDPEAERERARLEQLEREVRERQNAAPSSAASASSGALATARHGPEGSSIEAELEALRRRVHATGGKEPARRTVRAPTPVSGTPLPGGSPSSNAPPAAAPPTRVEDRDGDGRPDRWLYTREGRTLREELDDNGDGRPDRISYFDPESGALLRVEEDSSHDGRVDSWTYYEGGRIARRRADRNGDGAVDTWIFYREGHIAREENDSDGDGFRDRVDRYRDERLAERDEDLDGDGRTDRRTWFDAAGRPLRVEEDTDHDGRVDVRSYYEAGRLTRREILTDTALQEALGPLGAGEPTGPVTP